MKSLFLLVSFLFSTSSSLCFSRFVYAFFFVKVVDLKSRKSIMCILNSIIWILFSFTLLSLYTAWFLLLFVVTKKEI